MTKWIATFRVEFYCSWTNFQRSADNMPPRRSSRRKIPKKSKYIQLFYCIVAFFVFNL